MWAPRPAAQFKEVSPGQRGSVTRRARLAIQPLEGREMATYRYLGQVVHAGTRQGIAGLRVEAWDDSHVCTELVSAALTDPSGSFVISVDDGVVQDLFLAR